MKKLITINIKPKLRINLKNKQGSNNPMPVSKPKGKYA